MNNKIQNSFSFPQLHVCAAAELPRHAGKGVTHLLSIDAPEFPAATPSWFSGIHKHVFFLDVTDAVNANAPNIADIRKILRLGRDCLLHSRKAETHLLIHCAAGTSRSPAAAYAILCLWLGKGCENEAMERLLRIRPDIFPNRLVIEYADRILHRGGRMLNAIRGAMGKGKQK